MNTSALKSWIRSGFVVLLAVGGIRTSAQVDCLGVDGGSALPGSPCDDGQTSTGSDVWSSFCVCVGYCQGFGGGGFDCYTPGCPCNDGNANTTNDVLDGNCWCQGCILTWGPPGLPCNDGDPATVLDIVGVNGQCFGWSNHVTGKVFLDLDLSGTYTGGDVPLPNRVVHGAPGINYGITDANGDFAIGFPGPGFYTLAPASGSFDAPAQVFPAIDLSVPGVTSNGNELPMNALSLEGDLTGWSVAGAPRPGFWNAVELFCRNQGTVATGGTMVFTFDAQQTPLDQWPAGVVLGNTITWNIPLLQPGEQFHVHARMTTAPATALGTILTNTLTTTAAPPDAVPGNDVYTENLTVVGAFDPNDIRVSPEVLSMADIAAGSPVTYTVRFQNTGTFLAEDVLITDLIALQLRESSFELIGSSHPCQVMLHNGLLQFRFDDIMLPDSNANEPESHGWVMFRMTPQNFLLPGAQVYNSASIYFDFNEPIHTNSAVFGIELNTAITPSAQEAPALSLWPNPTSDLLNISMDRTSRTAAVTIIDMNGRLVRSLSNLAVQGGTATVPLSELADGLYTLRVSDGVRVVHQRFVKSH